MTDLIQKRPAAWEPLTPRGVAAFAQATPGRLWLIQLAFAVAAASALIWFLHTAWFPVVTDALERMPAEGQIRFGLLEWHGDSPTPLADRQFLALSVDLDHEGGRRSPAQVQVEFGRTNCVLISLLGCTSVAYPRTLTCSFGRAGLQPLWGAWRPILLWMAAGAGVVGLFLLWGVLASVYSLPAYFAAWVVKRDLTLGGSWRLAGAALMPGALLMTLAVVVYGLGLMDLVHLGLALALHLVLGWAYLAAGILSAPRHSQTPAEPENPFAAGPPTGVPPT